MLTQEAKARAVIIRAWSMLPFGILSDAIQSVTISDLGAHNGEYWFDDCSIKLNRRLFLADTPDLVPLIDDYGNFDPKSSRVVSRALHTCVHEFAHAIGEKTGLDMSPEWLHLSGWVEWSPEKELPYRLDRYIERREGWDEGPSDWAHDRQAWFYRDYSRKSPKEDFADSVALKALGWESRFDQGSGMRKLKYIERMVFKQEHATFSENRMYARKQLWNSLNLQVRASLSNGMMKNMNGVILQ
jgi:hypothetical protein